MYSRQEASILTQQFWTSFGQYLAPVRSADGEKINWINYKTSQKYVHFNMMADTKLAKIAITLSHKEPLFQKVYFDKLLLFKSRLLEFTCEDWEWRLHTTDQYGRIISEIAITLQPVNVLNKLDWPAIISFLKPRIIALDEFWCAYKDAFYDPPLK